MLRPGEPVWHTLNYIDTKLAITIDVKPHQLDVCRRCASLGAYFAAQQLADSQYLSSEITRQPETTPRRSFFHWLSWVLIIALSLFIMLLSGCHIQAQPDKSDTAAALYESDHSIWSDANIPILERQRRNPRFDKLKSLNDE